MLILVNFHVRDMLPDFFCVQSKTLQLPLFERELEMYVKLTLISLLTLLHYCITRTGKK
jgi:hypothetical protein